MATVVMGELEKRLKVLEEESEWLTPDETAAILKVDRRTVMRRFVDGTLPAMRFGDKWRTTRTALDKLMPVA